MSFLINFLLIIGFLAAICKADSMETLKIDLIKSLYNEKLSITGSKVQRLSLQKENVSFIETNNALIWKGKYNEETDVAIKIFWDQVAFDHELKILGALGVINIGRNRPGESKIIDNGILPVHYHGQFLNEYFAIAMTLFDETLQDRFKIQIENNKKINELDIMLLYKRAIEILQYIHGKNVDHNDINPKNIFLRGPDVFIGNFDLAKMIRFGNHEGQRHAMADFESLIYSLWSVAGMHQPNALNLAEMAKYGKAAAYANVKAKCAYFETKSVRKAFELTICPQILSKKDVPQHESINMVLQLTIVGLFGNSNEAKFSWLQEDIKTKLSRFASQLSLSSKK